MTPSAAPSAHLSRAPSSFTPSEASSTYTSRDPSSSPADVVSVVPSFDPSIRYATSIALGRFHTCAILDNFILKCWGSSIALGYRHSCAILDDTRLKCWGSNQFGQLGDSTTTTRTIPTEVDLGDDRHVISIALGYSHTCAILDNKKGTIEDN